MSEHPNTEEIILRKMDPAASQRILNYLLKELTRRNLLHPPEQVSQPASPDSVPEKR